MRNQSNPFFIIILALFSCNILSAQTTFKHEQNRFSRVQQARENREKYIDSLFNSLDINYPPKNIMIVAYKKEQISQLWAPSKNHETFTFVKEYTFTATSGTLGPKRKQGDMQIPEGFYHITHFNPFSNFHLSMKINYPNKSDSILGVKRNLGGEIRIHGSAVTIGCIPIGDETIEELYIICVDTKSAGQKDIPVYIFPCKMGYNNMMILKQNARNDTTLMSFWQNLKQGYDIFLRTHQELEFQVDIAGKYVFQNQINVHTYPWFNNYDKKDALINCVKVPEEYERIPAEIGSFESWLGNLPLKQGNPPIYLHNGAEKSYQGGHYAVVDIDVGAQDLQQCADAIIRFYAEFLYSKNDFDKIKFKITNGDVVTFRKWISGYRPIVSGNTVTWHMQVEPDSSYENLKKYLKFIFIYAGTYSLNQQLRKVGDINEMVIGDIFIQAGFPGHAIIVVEMAINKITGEKIFLLCQSFMPAQDIHILQNLNDPGMSPWYSLNFGDTLHTPEWTFEKQDLKRF